MCTVRESSGLLSSIVGMLPHLSRPAAMECSSSLRTTGMHAGTRRRGTGAYAFLERGEALKEDLSALVPAAAAAAAASAAAAATVAVVA